MSAYQWATVAVLAVVVWLLWALVHGGNRPEWPAMPADQRADFDQRTRAAQARIITPPADVDLSWLDEIVTDAEADLFMDDFACRILAAIAETEAVALDEVDLSDLDEAESLADIRWGN